MPQSVEVWDSACLFGINYFFYFELMLRVLLKRRSYHASPCGN